MAGGAVKSSLELLVLGVLRHGPAHGYAIIGALRERTAGEFDLAEGTVYPVLHRLEAAGLLASAWSEAGGRRRRVYRITRSGRRELGVKKREWSGFARAVEAVLA